MHDGKALGRRGLLTASAGLVATHAMAAGGDRPAANTRPGGPAIGSPASALGFDLATGPKRGWPASNNQFDNFNAERDWAYNFANEEESFAGIRWQPTWMNIQGFFGIWEPAGGDVLRVRRKGSSGRAARTLVFECAANPAAVPVGEPVVFWSMTKDGGANEEVVLDLSGYRLRLKQKHAVTASSGSAPYDPKGRRIIEIDAGQELPAIDHLPARVESQWGTMRSALQHRHWAFYKDSGTRALRHPIARFTELSLHSVLANGGYVMLGGGQWVPTWWDWSREWSALGASLVEELWRLECEGLAESFGNTDPRRCAVELENEPTQDYRLPGGAGYGDLLASVWYPTARRVWGRERTLVVKSTNWGAPDSMLKEFAVACPAGDNAHLVFHSYDHGAWSDIAGTNRLAEQCRARIRTLGYRGGGTTEAGVRAGQVPSEADRGQRMGRLLTSLASRDLYLFAWSLTGDDVRCSEIQSIGGRRIEAYRRAMAPYARRAGLMTS